MTAKAYNLALARIEAEGIRVDLTGCSANSFALVSRCIAVGESAGLSRAATDLFMAEAIARDRKHLIATILVWFEFNEADRRFLTSEADRE